MMALYPRLQVWYAERGSSVSRHAALWGKYRPLFPEVLRQRVESFQNWQDRQLCLLGKLLVCRALEDLGSVQEILGAYEVGEYGRPAVRLPGAPDFNLSHSGEYVVCAVLSGGGRVGVDIEYMRDISLADYEHFFPPSIWEEILQSEDQIAAFYRYWTIFESIVKAQGGGIGARVQDIKLEFAGASFCGQKWEVKSIGLFKEYSCHVVSDTIPSAFKVIHYPL
jgi:4'-phosphopantetheinyl transferase